MLAESFQGGDRKRREMDGIPFYKELEAGLEAETESADSDSKEEAEPGSGMSSFPFL